jgi:hypothetical protein
MLSGESTPTGMGKGMGRRRVGLMYWVLAIAFFSLTAFLAVQVARLAMTESQVEQSHSDASNPD